MHLHCHERAVRTGVLAALTLLNVALWVPKTDVLGNLLRDNPTLLGRYSEGHAAVLLIVLLASVVVLFVTLGPAATRKRRLFGVAATGLALGCSLVVADVALRLVPEPAESELHGDVAVRRPNAKYDVVYRDLHPAHACYPCLPPGYPPVHMTFRVDHRGFRNPTDTDTAGIVLIGDSFTEGYAVSDDQPWGRRFAETTHESVYNMGTNGASPKRYWEVFNSLAMELKPRTIMIMLFEGNDFQRPGTLAKVVRTPSLSKRLGAAFRHSPLRERAESALVALLGPINAPRSMPSPEVISWMPVAIPAGPAARYYSFEPRRLAHLSIPEEEFHQSPGWKTVELLLSQMSSTCRQNGVRLIVLYTPTKVHVVMPLVMQDLPPEQVARFVLLRGKGLPGGARDGAEFLSRFAVTVEAQEKVTAAYCRELGVEFLSFTTVLRQATAAGVQTYFTYDMHWTPDGHKVVADALSEYWQEHRTTTAAREGQAATVPAAAPARPADGHSSK